MSLCSEQTYMWLTVSKALDFDALLKVLEDLKAG